MAQIQTAYSCLTTLAADQEFTMLSLSINELHTLAKRYNIRERGFEKYALDGSTGPYKIEIKIEPSTNPNIKSKRYTTIKSALPKHPKLSTLKINLTATEDNITALHQAFGNVFLAIALSLEGDNNFETLKPFLVSRVYTSPESIEQFKEFAIEQLSNAAFWMSSGRRLCAILSENETIIKSLYQHPQCGIVIMGFNPSPKPSHEEITKLLDILIVTENNLDAVCNLFNETEFNQYKQRLMEAAADFLCNSSDIDRLRYTAHIGILNKSLLEQWAKEKIEGYCQGLKSLLPDNHTVFTKDNFISLKDHYHLHYPKVQFLIEINHSLANTYPNSPDVFNAWVMTQLITNKNTNTDNNSNIANQITSIMGVIFEYIDTAYEPDQQIIARLRCLKHCPDWLQQISIGLIVNPNNLETILTLSEKSEYDQLKQYMLEAAVSHRKLINIIHQFNERNETLWHRLKPTTIITLVSSFVENSPLELPNIIEKFNHPNINGINAWLKIDHQSIMTLFRLFADNKSTLFSDILSAFNHQEEHGISVWRNFITKPKIILELVQLLIKKEVISAHHIIDAINKPNNQNNTGWHIIDPVAITDLAQLFADTSPELLPYLINGINQINTKEETAWHIFDKETALKLITLFTKKSNASLTNIIKATNKPDIDGNTAWHLFSKDKLVYFIALIEKVIEKIAPANISSILEAFNHPNKQGDTAWHMINGYSITTLVTKFTNKAPENLPKIIQGFHQPNASLNKVWHKLDSMIMIDLFDLIAEKASENLPEIVDVFNQPNQYGNSVWHQFGHASLPICLMVLFTEQRYTIECAIQANWDKLDNYFSLGKDASFDNKICVTLLKIIDALNRPNKDGNTAWHLFAKWKFSYFIALVKLVIKNIPTENISSIIEAFNHPNNQGDTVWHTYKYDAQPIIDLANHFSEKSPEYLPMIIRGFDQPNETLWHQLQTTTIIALVELIAQESSYLLPDIINEFNKTIQVTIEEKVCNYINWYRFSAQEITGLATLFSVYEPSLLSNIINAFNQNSGQNWTVWNLLNGKAVNTLLKLFNEKEEMLLPNIVSVFNYQKREGNTIWYYVDDETIIELFTKFTKIAPDLLPIIIHAKYLVNNQNSSIWDKINSKTIIALIKISVDSNINLLKEIFQIFSDHTWSKFDSTDIIELFSIIINEAPNLLPDVINISNQSNNTNTRVWNIITYKAITDLIILFSKKAPEFIPSIIEDNFDNAIMTWIRFNTEEITNIITSIADIDNAYEFITKIIKLIDTPLILNIDNSTPSNDADIFINKKIDTAYLLAYEYYTIYQKNNTSKLINLTILIDFIGKYIHSNSSAPKISTINDNDTIKRNDLDRILFYHEHFKRNKSISKFFNQSESTVIKRLNALLQNTKNNNLDAITGSAIKEAIGNDKLTESSGTQFVVNEICAVFDSNQGVAQENLKQSSESDSASLGLYN